MNQTDLIKRVRRNAFIPTTHPTYTDQVILDELNDAMRSIYEDMVTIPRQGHWLKQYSFNSVVGQSLTRITPRGVIGGIEKVELGVVGQELNPLDQVTENHAQVYESFGGRTGTPMYYCIRGDQIEFLPAFNSIMTVRVSYYIKPSFLVIPQSVPDSNGRIQAFNPATLVITCVAAPTVQIARPGITSGTAITTNIAIDIVHPDGTFELSLIGVTPTVGAAGVYTLPVGTDVSEVAVGDFVRANQETDWPALPEEFHRTVADTASVKIMLQLNMSSKAAGIAQSVGGDLERFRNLINAPRTRRQPKRVCARLMTRGGGWGSYGRWNR